MNLFVIGFLGLAMSAPSVALENRLPDGYSLDDRITIEYDQDQCGELHFGLDNNDDCTIDFKNYFAATDFDPYRECQIKITVDLPKGLRMGPSLLHLEGEYQIGKRSSASVHAAYGLDYFPKMVLENTYYGPDHGEVSDAFLLSKPYKNHHVSSCGGKAVFEGTFKLGAYKGVKHALETEITLDRVEKENLAIWGWNYERCYPEVPDYCSGIAGDPALKHKYPECHPE